LTLPKPGTPNINTRKALLFRVLLLPGAGGGGATWSSGGFRPVVIMGGYPGSAIFVNILFYIAANSRLGASRFRAF